MSLRLRVAWLSAIVSAVIMVVGALALLGAFRSDQRAATQSILEQQFEVLAEPAVLAARARRPQIGTVLEQRLAAPNVVRVWDSGDLTLSVGAPDTDFGPPEPGVVWTGEYAVMTREVGVGARAATVQVAVPTDDSTAILARLRRRALRIVLVGTVLLAAGAWVAATAALNPLARLRTVTDEVAASTDLSRRVAGTDDDPTEIAQLATSFDVMMTRLEGADQQRRAALDSARSFGAAAAHELRTPLTSLGTNLEILRARPDHPERAQVLDDLLADHRRMSRLLDGLRVLARGDLAGPELFQGFDLADEVDQAVLDARRRHPDDTIELVAPDGPVPVTGWRDGLRIMIDNLVANALTHGRSGDGTARVAVTLAEAPHRVHLTVADLGPGIPVSERRRVLERFARGHDAGSPGTGLGLAMADQQAGIHGGELVISDGSQGGTEVTVDLARDARDR
jgi:two-component system sensor histidine kinase PrrB